MSKLQYLTRGNSSPQGKPRVYFCGHPKEQEFFLKPISQQILALQNCAIWYDAEPETPCNWEELSSDLSQMQLFVMPVTERLLNQPNRAMDKEFPFAIKHHIPVLPLMQESGLEEKFQEKFGDLQFLDANAHDSTAIPFEEKLQKFLNSILIGDELAAKVRAAFDAYIFLSYRKKDRREAQKLMRLIHQNEFCRDIAIWYDEFLVPGENFNEAIADALQKSKLFTLVVTPSLLENPNYVMTTEYPMAKTAEKPILPVEMTPTSRPELESCYESMPSCTKGEDAPALTESLTAALREVAIRKNDDDAQHNYFIGLAYLAGIDVEVDNHRAEALIRGAAEQGYEPAMEKLVSMYRSGEGVKRDCHKAIEWQKKLVEIKEKAWEETQTEDAFLEFTDALWDLGDFYEELEDIPNWRWVWETKMLPFCKTVWEKYRFLSALRYVAVSYNKLGDISKTEGNLQAARKYFELSLEIIKQLVDEAPTIQNRGNLSISYEGMGDISQAEGDIQTAKKYYKLSLEIRKQLADEAPTIKNLRNLSISYEKMGDISKAEKNISPALMFYDFALKIRKQLVAESPTIDIRLGLSIGYEKTGDIYEMEENFQKAQEFYEVALEICILLMEQVPTIENCRGVSSCYNRLGDIRRAKGDWQIARQFYEISLDIFKQLAEKSATLRNRRDLFVSYSNLGDICEEMRSWKSAQKYYEAALEICEQITEEFPTIENYQNLSIACERVDYCCRIKDVFQSTNHFYQPILNTFKHLAEEVPTPRMWDNLALSYYKLGTLDNSVDYLQKALDIWTKLSEQYPSVPRYAKNRDIVRAALKKLR